MTYKQKRYQDHPEPAKASDGTLLEVPDWWVCGHIKSADAATDVNRAKQAVFCVREAIKRAAK